VGCDWSGDHTAAEFISLWQFTRTLLQGDYLMLKLQQWASRRYDLVLLGSSLTSGHRCTLPSQLTIDEWCLEREGRMVHGYAGGLNVNVNRLRGEWMCDEHQTALIRYFCDKAPNGQWWFQAMNAVLRDEDIDASIFRETSRLIDVLDDALNASPELTADRTVYRGVRDLQCFGIRTDSSDPLDELYRLRGRVAMTLDGFTSTSGDRLIAVDFAHRQAATQPTLLELLAKEGTPAIEVASLPFSKLHKFGDQQEWLFPSGLIVEVHDVDHENDMLIVRGGLQ
jgi:hypothetical protein